MFFSEILEVVIGMIKDDVVTVEHKQETVCHVLNYIIVTDLGWPWRAVRASDELYVYTFEEFYISNY